MNNMCTRCRTWCSGHSGGRGRHAHRACGDGGCSTVVVVVVVVVMVVVMVAVVVAVVVVVVVVVVVDIAFDDEHT